MAHSIFQEATYEFTQLPPIHVAANLNDTHFFERFAQFSQQVLGGCSTANAVVHVRDSCMDSDAGL